MIEQTAQHPEQYEDPDGFLKEISTWSKKIAEELARKNDIGPLSDDHWKIIEFVQYYYKSTGEAPSIVKIGKDTGFSSKYICTLFTCGVAKGAYRLAGLPRPHGCL